MGLSEEELRTLYLRNDEDSDQNLQTEDQEYDDGPLRLKQERGEDDFFDLFGESDSDQQEIADAPSPSASGSDVRFAQTVIREWTSHLHQIPENQAVVNYLGFSKAAMADLVSELHIGAERLGLEQDLLNKITATEQSGTTREQLAGRQVLTACMLLSDFVAWLGLAPIQESDRPDSRFKQGKKLFSSPAPIAPGDFPELSEKPVDYSSSFIADWLVALLKMAEDNAGSHTGRSITPTLNEKLGRILKRFSDVRARVEPC
jgi:hypothetical protein